MEKLESRLCPICGKPCTSKSGTVIGLTLKYDMTCDNSHKWVEYYSLMYDGYKLNNKRYNRFGGELNET